MEGMESSYLQLKNDKIDTTDQKNESLTVASVYPSNGPSSIILGGMDFSCVGVNLSMGSDVCNRTGS